jgi:hypothetical protein
MTIFTPPLISYYWFTPWRKCKTEIPVRSAIQKSRAQVKKFLAEKWFSAAG